MKKITGLLSGILLILLPLGSLAADEAAFSVTSSKTKYSVGDEIVVSFSVDAGPYASSLNVIDFDVAIDNTAVIEPTNTSSPFIAGSIYSAVAMQSYNSGIINVVTYVNPENKPASRSGLIGTVTFKALSEGRATISYDRIEAAEENNDTEFVNTSAGSLTIEVESGSGSVSVSDTSGTSVSTVSTSTPTTSTSASTGPEHVALAAVFLGLLSFFLLIWYRNNKYYPKV